MTIKPNTLGALLKTGYVSGSVRDEMRTNLVRLMRQGEALFPDLHGYEDTVTPQVINAILAGHDILLLGERGQAKSRLARSLTTLLNEWVPIIEGSETNDDPLNPVSAYGNHLVRTLGNETPVAWVHRDQRFSEKLATPDSSIADLVGEVDPIKIAEGRYLSNEEIIAFGLIPRTNRGIFNINELPDLSERIQVGLLNILEERDIQIRGFTVRLPMDILMVASANPEDYTNRGRIITPLKDRFGSQIRTHYPATIEQELKIVRQENRVAEIQGVNVTVSPLMESLVAEISHVARVHTQVNARSGVSVRMTIANYEAIVANAQQRALLTGATHAVPGMLDLPAMQPSMQGKIEFDTWETSDDMRVMEDILGQAICRVGSRLSAVDWAESIVSRLDSGAQVYLDSSLPATTLLAMLDLDSSIVEGAISIVGSDHPESVVSGLSFMLEYLYRTGKIQRSSTGYAGLS